MIWTMTQKPNQKQEIARQQLNLENCMNLERMQLNFEKHQAAQLDQEEELSNLGMVNREQWKY